MNFRTAKMFLYKQKLAMLLSFFMLLCGSILLLWCYGRYNNQINAVSEFEKLKLDNAYYILFNNSSFDLDNNDYFPNLLDSISENPSIKDVIPIRNIYPEYIGGSNSFDEFSESRVITLDEAGKILKEDYSYLEDKLSSDSATIYAIVPNNFPLEVGEKGQLRIHQGSLANYIDLDLEIVAKQSSGQRNLFFQVGGSRLAVDEIFLKQPVVYLLDPKNSLKDEINYIEGIMAQFNNEALENEKDRFIHDMIDQGASDIYATENILAASQVQANFTTKRDIVPPALFTLAALIMFETLTILRFNRLKNRLNIFRLLGLSRSKIVLGLNIWSTLLIVLVGILTIVVMVVIQLLPEDSYWAREQLFNENTIFVVLALVLIALLVQFIINYFLIRKEKFLYLSEE